MNVRILTYNIHHWEGTDGRTDVARVTEVIRETGADLVALNEVYHPMSLPDLPEPPLAAMARALGMEFVFGPALPQASWGGKPAPYGNALLSRYPILAYAAHRLRTAEGHEPRSLLETRVRLPSGRAVSVYVTHLDHRSEEVRWEQVGELLLWTGRDRGRLHLLLGDFNALAPDDLQKRPLPSVEPERWAEEPRVISRLARAGYVDAFAAVGQGAGETYPTPEPAARIDYCFVSEAGREALRLCQRWDAGAAGVASDHLPVLAVLDL